MNGVIYICPEFYDERYNGIPSVDKNYYSEIFNTDESLNDYDDKQLFQIFSKEEIRVMINVLTYALSDCIGELEKHDTFYQ
jgi:hypothetical protein